MSNIYYGYIIFFKFSITSNNFSISFGVNDEVGSSITTTDAFWNIARAISTICCSEIDKFSNFFFYIKIKTNLV